MHKPVLVIGILALVMAGCSQTSAVSNPPSPVACTAPAPSADQGAISGQLGYPSDFIPPLTIYAIPVGAVRASAVRASGACYRTVQTVLNQLTFHLLSVPVGNYYVLASWQPAVTAPVASPTHPTNRLVYFGGAYTEAVRCGLLSTCGDHSLIPVSVVAGHTTAGIQVTDWYTPSGTFPKVPTNAPAPATLPPEPASFSSPTDAAIYYLEVATGGMYTQSPCPVNRACVTLGSLQGSINSGYFLGTAGSNTDLQSCGVYLYFDLPGASPPWHKVDTVCKAKSPVFPSVGANGIVAGSFGGDQCIHVRQTASRTGVIAGCIAPGTTVTVDGGPVYFNESDPSLDPMDQLWWHLKGLGWMVHTYLRNG